MRMSARILGKEFNLTAEEMNRVLAKLGFLKGEPGDYSITEKGAKYIVEKVNSSYGKAWLERSIDESIKGALNISDKLIKEVKSEAAAHRAAQIAIRKAEEAAADASFIASQEALKKVGSTVVKSKGLISRLGPAGVAIITAGYASC